MRHLFTLWHRIRGHRVTPQIFVQIGSRTRYDILRCDTCEAFYDIGPSTI